MQPTAARVTTPVSNRSDRPARHALLVPAILLAAGALLAGCRSAEPAGDRHTLIDSRDKYDPRSLDPARATDVPSGRAVSYLFDGLTQFTPDARVEPALAERWEVTPDGL